MSAKAVSLAARYGRKTDVIEIWKDIIEERYSIPAFDNPPYPIITNDEQIQVMSWGLIPWWVKPKDDSHEEIEIAQKKAYDISKSTINARAETVFEKLAYRGVIRRKRCLIPSTGYFEFHYDKDVKGAQPYFIYLQDHQIFSMAGIYDTWHDPETGEKFRTFSQITTAANPLTAKIHNGGKNPYRMPVIFTPDDEQRWLDPDLTDAEIKSLMKPYPDKWMDAYPVSREFRKLDQHDPAIVYPID